MSELYDQIVSQRGGFENLVNRIPGFHGYYDKKSRRKADQLLRDYLAEQVTARISRLANMEVALVDNGGLAYMSDTRRAKDRLQTYRDRVETAVSGYSGFMEAVKVDEESLERVYAFDEAQVRYLDRIDGALNDLQTAITANENIPAALTALASLGEEMNEAYTLREDVLLELNKSLGGSPQS